jgi:hypothetical protein
MQSAQAGLLVDINIDNGVERIGAPLQALVKKPEANQWWMAQQVPGWPGYVWITTLDNLSIGIDNSGGVKSGSRLQALVTEYDQRMYWRIEDVPGRPGYFWIVSAVDGLVVDIECSPNSRVCSAPSSAPSKFNVTWLAPMTSFKMRAGCGFASA